MSFLVDQAINQVKAAVAKADANKNGVPDLVEHLEAFEKVLLFVEQLGSRFSALDWERLLIQVNAVAGQKFSAAEIRTAAAALAQVGPAAHALAKAVHSAEESLDPKAKKK